jgi:dihydroorotase-like cyclic amidohydrolase
LFDGAEWLVGAFASKSRNCAFLGERLRGKVIHTVYAGSLVVADGKAQR